MINGWCFTGSSVHGLNPSGVYRVITGSFIMQILGIFVAALLIVVSAKIAFADVIDKGGTKKLDDK